MAASSTKTPQWSYKGVDGGGKRVKGVLEAQSESHAIQQLRAQSIMPESLERKGEATGLQMEINIPGFEKYPSLKDLALLTRQLATMVNSGVSILRALSIVQGQVDNVLLRKAMETVATRVEGGMAFSIALEEHPRIIPPIMVHLVRAGETGGFLDKSLLMVADNFEAENKLRSQVKSALSYPIVVLVVAVVAVAAMLIFIVPVFENMFADLGGDLPAATQGLVDLSHAMPVIGPIALVIIIAVSIWWTRNKNTDAVRRVVDPLKLKAPVFGKLNSKIALTRFTRNFSTMLASGVPILQSLAIVGATSDNWVINNSLTAVQDAVRQGRPIAEALAESDVFPDMLVQMVGIGEESGSIDTMLSKTADFYDQEVEAMSSSLTAMLEPLMIVVMGGLLGYMIVALYLPTFTIFESIQTM
ncbi:type II secretion system F family protein [Microbacterium sp. GXF6406]